MASTERTNSRACASGISFAATKTTGTRVSSQSMGLWRISLSNTFIRHPIPAARIDGQLQCALSDAAQWHEMIIVSGSGQSLRDDDAVCVSAAVIHRQKNAI